MKIYKETVSDEIIKIKRSDLLDIVEAITMLLNTMQAYCTSDDSYSEICSVVDKEGE